MFGAICAIIAIWLSRSSLRPKIAAVIAIEFVAHKYVYIIGHQIAGVLNARSAFLSYAAINLIALYLVKRYKGHVMIALLLFINLCYNLVTFKELNDVVNGDLEEKFIVFYANYKPFVGIIMIFELIYLAFLSTYCYGWINRFTNSSTFYLDRLFCSRAGFHGGYDNRGIA